MREFNLEMSKAKNIIEGEILEYIAKKNLDINKKEDWEYLLECFMSNYVANNEKYFISFAINIEDKLLNVEFVLFEKM